MLTIMFIISMTIHIINEIFFFFFLLLLLLLLQSLLLLLLSLLLLPDPRRQDAAARHARLHSLRGLRPQRVGHRISKPKVITLSYRTD